MAGQHKTSGFILSMNNSLSSSLFLRLMVVTLMGSLYQVSGYKILATALPGKSHIIAMSAFCKELASRGHQVHFLVGASFEVDIDPNTPNIHVERFGSPEYEMIDYDQVMNQMTAQVLGIQGGTSDVQVILDKFFEDDSTQLLVHSEPLFEKLEKIKFDMAIIDGMFMMSYQYLAPLRLGIPWVSLAFLLSPWDVPSPILPSFVPSKLSLLTDKMTFVERITNVFFTLVPMFSKGKDPKEEIVVRYRKYGDFETSHDLVSRSLLFFTTCDVVLDYPMPTMPNIVHVGGLTVKPASGLPLPQQIQDFISTPSDGVIVITFGTLGKLIPKGIAEKFVEGFRQLPNYKILWRLLNKDKLPLPENVLTSEWLPQNDLLADKRVKLFITHCGNNGQFEAVYHAVPMIGFPIYIDQGYNAKRIENKGFGLAMNIHEFTADQLVTNVKRVISDGSFKSRITKASEIFRSAKDTPVQRAAYWIEHVIKFGGDHLKSAGRDLNFFQYMMLDILALILFVIILLVLVGRCIVKGFCSLICKKSDVGKSTNSKSKKLN